MFVGAWSKIRITFDLLLPGLIDKVNNSWIHIYNRVTMLWRVGARANPVLLLIVTPLSNCYFAETFSELIDRIVWAWTNVWIIIVGCPAWTFRKVWGAIARLSDWFSHFGIVFTGTWTASCLASTLFYDRHSWQVVKATCVLVGARPDVRVTLNLFAASWVNEVYDSRAWLHNWIAVLGWISAWSNAVLDLLLSSLLNRVRAEISCKRILYIVKSWSDFRIWNWIQSVRSFCKISCCFSWFDDRLSFFWSVVTGTRTLLYLAGALLLYRHHRKVVETAAVSVSSWSQVWPFHVSESNRSLWKVSFRLSLLSLHVSLLRVVISRTWARLYHFGSPLHDRHFLKLIKRWGIVVRAWSQIYISIELVFSFGLVSKFYTWWSVINELVSFIWLVSAGSDAWNNLNISFNSNRKLTCIFPEVVKGLITSWTNFHITNKVFSSSLIHKTLFLCLSSN